MKIVEIEGLWYVVTDSGDDVAGPYPSEQEAAWRYPMAAPFFRPEYQGKELSPLASMIRWRHSSLEK